MADQQACLGMRSGRSLHRAGAAVPRRSSRALGGRPNPRATRLTTALLLLSWQQRSTSALPRRILEKRHPFGLWRQKYGGAGLRESRRQAKPHPVPTIGNELSDTSDWVFYSLAEDGQYEPTESPNWFVQSAIQKFAFGKITGKWSVRASGDSTRLELRFGGIEAPALPLVGRVFAGSVFKPLKPLLAGASGGKPGGYENPLSVERFDVIHATEDELRLRFTGTDQEIRWPRIRGPVLG